MAAAVKRMLGRLTGLGSMPRLPAAGGETTGSAPSAGPPVRLVVFGESTAVGVGVDTLEDALPGCLARAVAGLSGRAVSWQVIGKHGMTARSAVQLVPQLIDSGGEGVPDIVVVVLGVNDLVRFRLGRIWRRDLTTVLLAIREAAPTASVLVAGIPPAYLSPALPKALGRFAGRRARMMDRQTTRAARLVGAVVETVSHIGPQVDDRFFAADRFHPSSHGYLIWSRYLAIGVAGLIT